jgi:hypothetical protein
MKTLPLWLALTCSVPAMANQAESCEGTVLSAAQFEFAGTVVPLLKTLRPDGVLCRIRELDGNVPDRRRHAEGPDPQRRTLR